MTVPVKKGKSHFFHLKIDTEINSIVISLQL